jgi:hypothetical protein
MLPSAIQCRSCDAARTAPGRACVSPVRLSIAVSWTGSQGPVSPPVFPVNGSPLATPPFPRPGLDGLDSPASPVLRRRYDSPLRMTLTLMMFAPALHADLLVRALAEALPPDWRSRAGQDSLITRPSLPPGCSSRGRIRGLPGSLAVLPMPLPSSRTPVGPILASHYARQVLPPQRRKRGLRRSERFRGYHLASAHAVYASRALSPGPCKTRFRLAG